MSNSQPFDIDGVEAAPWPELVPLAPELAQGNPYPLKALPKLMAGAARDIAKQVMAPEGMAAQCVVGAVTHIAQTRVNASHPLDLWGDGMPCSLFLLTLGDSGDGKSRCRYLAFRELDKAEREANRRYRQQRDDLLEQASDEKGDQAKKLREAAENLPDGKRLFDDVTIESLVGLYIRGLPAASWDTDEGGQFFGGHSLQSDTKANALGVLTKAYDNGHVSRVRSKANAEGSGTANNRRLSIHMLAQGIVVQDALSNSLLRGQGLLARVLFTAPPSLAGTRFVDVEQLIQQRNGGAKQYYPELSQYWSRTVELMETPEHVDEHGEVHPPLMPLEDDAVRALMVFNHRIEAELAPLGDYSDVKQFARRALEQATRLATVFVFFDGGDRVTKEWAERAIEVAQHSLDEWMRYSAASAISPAAQKAMHFIDWILEPERIEQWRTFSSRQFSRTAPNALRPLKVRNEVLAVLVAHNYLAKNGNEYTVNPRCYLATIATSATKPLQANADVGYSGLESCDIVATPCDKPATNAEQSQNVAACRKHVANQGHPQTRMNKGLRGNVANVADVATPAHANADGDGWEVL